VLGAGALAALPAVLTVYLAFTAGGFFAGSTGVAAVVVWIALAVRISLADRPAGGLSPILAGAAAALALFAVLTLVSSAWSDSASRALVEFDRAILYLGLLVLFGSVPRDERSTQWALRAQLAAFGVIGTFALLSRVLPDVLTIRHDIVVERLSYPLTYWNTLGLLLGVGVILALHFACSEREPAWMRVLAAGIAPVLTTALYFTLSRGAIAATVAGVVLYLLLARPRGAVAGLVALLPACAIAVVASYDADKLVTNRPTSAAAVDQGEHAALVIGLSVLLGLVLRAAGLLLDRRLARVDVSAGARRGAWAGVAAAALVALVVCWFSLDLGDRIESQYDGFVHGTTIQRGGDIRSRLTDPGNNGRLDHWRVALDAFDREPLHGTGAGTYGITWARDRPSTLKVEDAHSLYIEQLSELGLPGFLLVVTALVLVLVGFGRGIRGPQRHVYAALFAAGGAWALHAGIDWDWEMPAVTLWFWAFGGMALATAGARAARRAPANLTRIVASLACLALAVTPALMVASQAQLNDAVASFKRGDCGTAIDSALGSLRAMPSRPQPFEVLGYCDARVGDDRLAIGAMRSGIDRDPDNWELWYGLALVRANAGADPRPAARTALRLNPRGGLPRDAVRRFDTADPDKWKRRAQRARLPIR
jgi:hypothetical protein